MDSISTVSSPRSATERFPFTERRLEVLTGDPRYVYDSQEAGLCVRLTPRGKSYVFYRWYAGRPERVTLGKVAAISLRNARSIAAAYRGDLARGVNVFARMRQEKAAPKPQTLIDAYIARMARPDTRPSTRRDYESLWKLVPARLRNRAVTDIASPELAKLHADIGRGHRRTANKLMALISVLLTRSGRRHNNPVTEVVRFSEEPRQRVLTVIELQRIRTALEVEQEPWRSFFLLGMLTGARRGALARVRWDDLDLDAAVWRIPAVWSKNKRVLSLALASEAVRVLRTIHEVRGTSPWVFPSHSATGHLTEPRKAWTRICERAGITNAHIHDLRRTLGTAVAADGNGAAIVSAVLGHLSAQSARAYIHLSAEAARSAVEAAARKLTVQQN